MEYSHAYMESSINGSSMQKVISFQECNDKKLLNTDSF